MAFLYTPMLELEVCYTALHASESKPGHISMIILLCVLNFFLFFKIENNLNPEH